MGHLTVILGCMFAQKTTELVRYIRRYRSIGHSVLVVNHSLDDRYGGGGVVTHDEKRESGVMASYLAELDEAVRSGTYQVVVVDEAQFFPDLFDHITRWADECTVQIVVAGLDGTFARDPFGDLLRLVPHAEEVIRLSALCVHCRDGSKAIYSRRKKTIDTVTMIGGGDMYEAVCRKHYLE